MATKPSTPELNDRAPDPAHTERAHTDHDVASLSYEQARDELVKVVAELEQGSSTLEQSLALWERGEALAQRCEEWLIGAKSRLDAARSAAASRDSASRAALSDASPSEASSETASSTA